MGSAQLDLVNAAYPAMAEFYASDWAALEAANEGYYVGMGCAISASGTAGKVDMTAGITLLGTVEVKVAAVTAASTTITSMADATNPKWVGLEIDASGVLQFNQGTAAASPLKPALTASRVLVAWLYVPATATAVDALLSTANGKAKIMDARQIKPGPSPTGWHYDQNTWTFVSSTTGAGGGLITYKLSGVDASGYLRKGVKVSWDDGTNTPGYGVIASVAFSTDTTVTLILQSDYVMANAAIKYPRYSYQLLPQGFPTWFNWSPTLAGWSANPTNTVYRWKADATAILIQVRQATAGTSNLTAHSATLPVVPATITNMAWNMPVQAVDNGTTQVGIFSILSAGASLTLGGIFATALNTASGSSRITGEIVYEF